MRSSLKIAGQSIIDSVGNLIFGAFVIGILYMLKVKLTVIGLDL